MTERIIGTYVFCSCGRWLVAKIIIDSEAKTSYFEVEPCESCIKRESSEAFDLGFIDGFEEGKVLKKNNKNKGGE